MPSKSYRARQLERRRAWSRNANAAKARKRLAQAQTAECVGEIAFSGHAFGGAHVVRCLTSRDPFRLHIEIDGIPHRPRTVRGIVRVLARRLYAVTPAPRRREIRPSLYIRKESSL